MNKPKHTPGPWIYQSGTKTIRAEVPNYWLATMDSWDGAVDHEANARLIAAAPELLEAAQLLLDTLEHDEKYGCFDGFGRRDQENTRDFFNRPEIKALVRAIAKATGGDE